MKAPNDVNHGCGSSTSSVELTSNAPLEEKQSHSGNCSQVGVSSYYVPIENLNGLYLELLTTELKRILKLWKRMQFTPTIPKHCVIQNRNSQKKSVLEPLLLNLVFIHSTQSHLEELFREENDLNHLRFYRDKTKNVSQQDEKHPPVVVPYYEMLNFIKLTSVESEHIKLVEPEHCHYKCGDKVRIVDGDFAGVEGRVTRITGQQRVVVEIDCAWWHSLYT